MNHSVDKYGLFHSFYKLQISFYLLIVRIINFNKMIKKIEICLLMFIQVKRKYTGNHNFWKVIF